MGAAFAAPFLFSTGYTGVFRQVDSHPAAGASPCSGPSNPSSLLLACLFNALFLCSFRRRFRPGYSPLLTASAWSATASRSRGGITLTSGGQLPH